MPILRGRGCCAPAPGASVARRPVRAPPVVVMWRKRIFRCAEPVCPVTTFSPGSPVGRAPGSVDPAGDHLGRGCPGGGRHDGLGSGPVSGGGWHTLWRAVKVEAAAPPFSAGRGGIPGRRRARVAAGPLRCRPRRYRDGRSDPRRGRRAASTAAGHGCGAFRHGLQEVVGRPGAAFREGVKHAALDPFRGTPTRCATASGTPSRSWTRSTSSSSAPR